MTRPLFNKVLIANRGEVALRIVRALRELAIASVAVYADDDAQSPHVSAADVAVALGVAGPAAYLDGARLIAIAREHGCDAVHPGYGFLSERADFAAACAAAGVRFIGPSAEQLALFGDKARSRTLAERCGVPVMPGSRAAVSLDEARAFFIAQRGAGVMVKAIGGGGGRGMRAVTSLDDLPAAYERCRSEAKAAFGVDGVYVERLMSGARHIEIQIVGDGHAALSLGERECTLQRRFQKLVEIAPSPSLTEPLRQRIVADALGMAREVRYEGLGTFEFLVDPSADDLPYVFIEANPRLQVEHTVTEEVTGVDLVQTQIALAAGERLADLGLDPGAPPVARGFAIQWRINAETLDAQGHAQPGSGTLTRFDLPAGPGIRVDTHGVAGGSPSPHYDTLLAKLIVHTRGTSFDAALRRSARALAEFRIDGVATSLPLLRALAAHPAMATQQVHTRWLEAALPALVEAARDYDDARVCAASAAAPSPASQPTAPEHALLAPMPARVVQWSVSEGEVVAAGAELGVLESMKMEHLLHAPHAGRVISILATPGGYLAQGQPVLVLEPVDAADAATVGADTAHDPDHIRADLQKVRERHALTLDAARPDAIAKRRARGGRTARENIADLCDDGSFIEYGALAIAAQRSRRTLDDLIANTPADGIVTGIGSVNGALFGAERARTTVMSYDATVLAGTQGFFNHAKTDRLLELSLKQKLPVVLFAEGGGGRPGDESARGPGLDVGTFASYAALSGQVPVVGIAAGRCFAGNAALLGCSDVIVATRNSNIGMGGPAMIEGGGLGVYTPEQIGPSAVQHANGVIDLLADDERDAVALARRYLAFFQGATKDWRAPDQRTLRHVVPENRLRVYDTRSAMSGLVDEDSLLMLRSGFGIGIHTALARIEGRPVGVIANNPLHLGGAIDAHAADKAARFLQLCNVYGLPVVSLVDTPGFMVGPEVETTAQVRHVSRLFVTGAHLRVPVFAVVLRKGYGLGAMGMTAGGFHGAMFTISWPTGEFGGMGLEGAVRLGYRKELEALPPGPERDALFDTLLARQYERGAALSMGATLEIDAVVDPAETRAWLVRGLASAKVDEKLTPFVDTW